ncbi:30S ribosomal protein S1 [Paenibacillus antri]|uniref:30S ribosomal protein S1 n=1 Tax=Paenibacillus antri TaxID=2582848 RepID=A0A5R9GMB8_9BACL|nr:30S ribosomal protein S1 [Paenibacillus antri]TLS53075.1 30S ribosomal protein S1 [Paenibacillus antri]
MTEETKVQANEQAAAESADTVDMNEVSTVKKGDIVTGTVVKVEDNQVYVDIGYKYDGVITARELSSVPLDNISDVVQLGQEVTCKVIGINDAKETLTLSKKQVEGEKAWDKMQEYLDNNETIEAKVVDVVKGGLVVDVGVRGFIPASMVERHFVEDFSDYKGRTLKLKVKEIDRPNNKLILSQKDVLEEQYQAQKQQIMERLNVGDVIEGTVQRLTQFGAFVDVGGVDGLVHISELSYQHVEKPSDVVKEGDKVKVKILKLDPANERISLSVKAAQPGPWEQAGGQFQIGDIIQGTVRRLVDFGAFVEVAPGVEGLVHVSQIAHRRIGTPHEVLKEGQQVNVKVLDINVGEKRISLSIKETEEAPEQPQRQERPERAPRQPKVDIPDAQSLNLTLGERFGDKLSKFK